MLRKTICYPVNESPFTLKFPPIVTSLFAQKFVFKGKGTRIKVAAPDGIKFSPSGSYHLEHLEKTISNLPNRFNPFTHNNFAVYVLRPGYTINISINIVFIRNL